VSVSGIQEGTCYLAPEFHHSIADLRKEVIRYRREMWMKDISLIVEEEDVEVQIGIRGAGFLA
jgi:hypothetical protein